MCDVFSICFCFPPDPLDNAEEDPRIGYSNRWSVQMKDAPTSNPGYCLLGCCCPCCVQYSLRKRILQGDMQRYSLCQGYFSTCGVSRDTGRGSECCLVFEVCCCLSCAVSANRFYLMDQYNIVSDPCDNRIIRFNNCVQLASCILDIVAIFVAEARDAANILDLIAKCVYFSTVGCMSAQMDAELKFRQSSSQTYSANAPPTNQMDRGTYGGSAAPPPPGSQQQQGTFPVAEAVPVTEAKPTMAQV